MAKSKHYSIGLIVFFSFLFKCVRLTPVDFRELENATENVVSVNVKVEQGEMKGVQVTTGDDIQYVAFFGVPYAKPPVGDLRFRSPQTPEPWIGVYDANRSDVTCIQRNMFTKELMGDEDCLVLNVYTTKLPHGSYNDALLPVMVWIHGGAFEGGSGDSVFYGPDFFMTQNVIIVTLNYRLGPLGFLNIKDALVSSNAGLKDQVAALKWVNRNIEHFGGDPNQVTIFGESAGAACVHFHMLSSMSKGLFHRAISQSGSALNPWAYAKGESSHQRAVLLAKAMGCDTSTMTSMINCLKNARGNDLVERSHDRNILSEEDLRHGIRFPFIPSSEKDAEGDEEVFLSGEPIDLIKAGHLNHVPYITGLNDQETILFLPLFFGKNDMTNVEKEFERIVPADLLVRPGKPSTNVAKKIRKFYFGNQAVSKATIPNVVNLTTDTYFLNGIYKTVKIQSAISSAPIYFYQFTYDGEFGMMKRILGFSDMPGATHGDELSYLFKNNFLEVDLQKDSVAVKTLFKMVKMWTNFAKTGDPSSEMGSLLNVKWTPATPSSMSYLRIDAELSMQVGVENERIEFWDKIYSDYANDTYAEYEDNSVNEIEGSSNSGNPLIAVPWILLTALYATRGS